MWEPHYIANQDEWANISALMYNAPSVQMLEDYIAEIGARTKKGAIDEAMRLGHENIAKMLKESKRRCSVIVRLGRLVQAGNADIDNVAKLALDGCVPAVIDNDAQVKSLRVDAPYDSGVAKKKAWPTYISIITAKNLEGLERAPQTFGGAFVYPISLYDQSFTARNAALKDMPVLNR